MDNEPIEVDPRFGDLIVSAIEKITGKECAIIMIVLPIDDGSIKGSPSFVTNLEPKQMEDIVTQIAAGFPDAGDPIINRGFRLQ